MLHLSTKNLQRYDSQFVMDGDASQLTYVYAVASMTQLAQIAHDVQKAGAKPVAPAVVRQHLREYVETLADDADKRRLLELLDAKDKGVVAALPKGAKRRRKAQGDEAKALAKQAEADLELLAMARRAAEAEWEPYREAAARAKFYQRIISMSAVRMLLRGLEGPAAEKIQFSAPHGAVDEGTLRRMGFALIEEAGAEILAAAQLSGSAAKN